MLITENKEAPTLTTGDRVTDLKTRRTGEVLEVTNQGRGTKLLVGWEDGGSTKVFASRLVKV